ncbi:MAG: ExbD/TolR family protein [Limisphaerales bacterium]
MKFARHSRLLRGSFDMAPFAAVLFLLLVFLLLGALLPTAGLPLRLPVADDLPGTDKPTIAVAVDAGGRFYFANQMITEDKLKSALKTAVRKSPQPLTLVIHADKAVTYDQLVQLVLLAQAPDIGITNLLLATLPRVVNAPAKP